MSEKGKGLRYNNGKLRYDLEHPFSRRDFVDVLTYGADKYTVYDDDGKLISSGERNWELGMKWSNVIASAKRHLAAIEAGEDFDYDSNCDGCQTGKCMIHSGKLHVSLLQANAHFLNAYYYIYPQGDDRPKMIYNLPKIGLDIDELIADWLGAWCKKFNIAEKPHTWDFDPNILKKFNEMKKSDELNDFYLNLEPLVDPKYLPFEPHCYITSRPVPKEITELWLEINDFPCKPVYSVELGASKLEAAKLSGIDVFIDDSYKNFLELNRNGILCYLYDRPHNERYDVGHLRIKSLDKLPLLGKIEK